MNKKTKIFVGFVVLLVLAMALAGCGGKKPADEPGGEVEEPKSSYPEMPVKIIVARSAGGSTDVVARMFQPFLQKHLGGNVIVENVAGAGGKIGTTQVFKAEPDGYTLLMGVFPSDVLSEIIDQVEDYSMKEFIPIYNVQGGETNAVVVPYDSPYQTLEDLIGAAKANPGKINMAVTGGISNSSLGVAMLTEVTKAEFTKVPYDSGSEALQATMGGHVEVTTANIMNTYQPYKDKKIRVLAHFGPKRDDNMPDVPTFGEIYGEEYSFITYVGVLAPPGLPDDIRDALIEACREAVNDPEFASTVADAFTIMPMEPDEFKQRILADYSLAEEFRTALEAMK